MDTQTVRLDRDVLIKLEAIKPRYIALAPFCSYVLDRFADAQLAELTDPPLQSPQHSLLEEKSSERDREGLTGCEADSHKGRERERQEKRRFVFSVPDSLQWCDEPLEVFWKEGKKGAKSERAANFLFEELTKMEGLYGKQVVLVQLKAATAHRWESITVANYERFGLPKGTISTSDAEVHKSNAGCYRDFTAERLERERLEMEAANA